MRISQGEYSPTLPLFYFNHRGCCLCSASLVRRDTLATQYLSSRYATAIPAARLSKMSASTESNNSSATPKAEIYDTERFGQLYYGFHNPPVQSLGLATRYIIPLFRSHEIPFALLGGWAIYLRGGERPTERVDIVASYMDNLKAMVLREQRYAAITTGHGGILI